MLYFKEQLLNLTLSVSQLLVNPLASECMPCVPETDKIVVKDEEKVVYTENEILLRDLYRIDILAKPAVYEEEVYLADKRVVDAFKSDILKTTGLNVWKEKRVPKFLYDIHDEYAGKKADKKINLAINKLHNLASNPDCISFDSISDYLKLINEIKHLQNRKIIANSVLGLKEVPEVLSLTKEQETKLLEVRRCLAKSKFYEEALSLTKDLNVLNKATYEAKLEFFALFIESKRVDSYLEAVITKEADTRIKSGNLLLVNIFEDISIDDIERRCRYLIETEIESKIEDVFKSLVVKEKNSVKDLEHLDRLLDVLGIKSEYFREPSKFIADKLHDIYKRLVRVSFEKLFYEVKATDLKEAIYQDIAIDLKALLAIEKRVFPELRSDLKKYLLPDKNPFSLLDKKEKGEMFQDLRIEIEKEILLDRLQIAVNNYDTIDFYNEDLHRSLYAENDLLARNVEVCNLYASNNIQDLVNTNQRRHNIFVKSQIAIYIILDELEFKSYDDCLKSSRILKALSNLESEETNHQNLRSVFGENPKIELDLKLDLKDLYSKVFYLLNRNALIIDLEMEGYLTKRSERVKVFLERKFSAFYFEPNEVNGLALLCSVNINNSKPLLEKAVENLELNYDYNFYEDVLTSFLGFLTEKDMENYKVLINDLSSLSDIVLIEDRVIELKSFFNKASIKNDLSLQNSLALELLALKVRKSRGELILDSKFQFHYKIISKTIGYSKLINKERIDDFKESFHTKISELVSTQLNSRSSISLLATLKSLDAELLVDIVVNLYETKRLLGLKDEVDQILAQIFTDGEELGFKLSKRKLPLIIGSEKRLKKVRGYLENSSFGKRVNKSYLNNF